MRRTFIHKVLRTLPTCQLYYKPLQTYCYSTDHPRPQLHCKKRMYWCNS